MLLWAVLLVSLWPPPTTVDVALPSGVIVVRSDRSCAPDDPFAEMKVDPRRRRIELCRTNDANARRRQILAGYFLLDDQAAGWSREPTWQQLNGWSRSMLGEWTAQNQAAEAYATPSGRRSPGWDLATFAADWIVERMASQANDLPLTCRLLPQARFLHRRLLAVTALPAVLRAPPRCAPYEAWAGAQSIERIEIVLATPSTVSMASMFGHVFLRLVQRPEDELLALDDRTVAFLVENTVPVEEDPFYAWKGIAGQFEATLVERSLLETYRTYVVAEGRDLRRFRLNLSPEETDALLERLWSLEHAGRFRYRFFANNCATLMVDMINTVLPVGRQIRYPEALATTPAGTLEGYAGAVAAGGGPLVTFIPDTILSFEHQARAAAVERRRLSFPLRSRDPRGADPWGAIESPDPDRRAGAYGRVVEEQLRAGSDPRWLQRFLRQSAVIEAHLSALANLEAEQALFRQRRRRLRAELAAQRARLDGNATARCVPVREAIAQGVADDPEVRLRGYRALATLLDGPCESDLADQVRRLALLSSAVHHDSEAMPPALHDALFFPERARPLGEQRYAAGIGELIDYPFVTRLSPALLAVQHAQVTLAANGDSLASPASLQRVESLARQSDETAVYDTAVPRTGIDQLELGAGVDSIGTGTRSLLILGGALHDERLGDQRRFGFPAHTALTVLRTRTALAWQNRHVALAGWDARLLGYRSLPPLPAPRFRPGGDLFVDVGQRRGLEVRLGGGALLPIVASQHLADHLLFSAGPVGGFDRIATHGSWSIGASLGLEARLAPRPASQTTWLAAAVAFRPLLTTAGPVRELAASADVRVPIVESLRIPLGRAPTSALVLRVSAALHAASRPAPPDRQLSLTLALE
jgi:hypothetical protein